MIVLWAVSPESCMFNKTIRHTLTELGLSINDSVSPESCMFNKTIRHTLTELGSSINEEKSHLDPSRVLEYIGYIVSTEEEYPRVSIPKKRINALRHDIMRILREGIYARPDD